MALNIGDNFSYLGKKFLDNRGSFNTLEEMNLCTSVPDGFITYCKEDKKRYEFKDGVWVEYIIDSESVDLIDYAKIKDIPTKLSDLTNDNNYVTETIMNEIIDKELNNSIEEVNNILELHENDINKILEVVDEPPIFIRPTLNLTLDKTVIEHNIPTNITISPTFNQNDAGNVTRYVLKRDGNTLLDTTSIRPYVDTITITHEASISYTATVFYDEGASKISTFGVEYPGINAGKIDDSDTVTAHALSYYGVIDEDYNIISVLSRTNTSKSFTTTYDMTSQKSFYMYPQSFGLLTSIKDSNNFEYIDSYAITTSIYNDVDYYVYILTDTVSIAGFKQIFD